MIEIDSKKGKWKSQNYKQDYNSYKGDKAARIFISNGEILIFMGFMAKWYSKW